MVATRRAYSGGAKAGALISPISSIDTSLLCDALLGWPTGSDGRFAAVIGRGLTNEEKVLCSAQTSATLTVVQRGYDGTIPQAHGATEIVEHVITATDMDEANAHTSTVSGHGIPAGDAIVGVNATQTLTGKTMDGDLNTFTDLPLAASPETILRFQAVEAVNTTQTANITTAAAAAAAAAAASSAADALRYTKIESDARYEPIDTMYTKAEADLRYEPLDSAYTKAESDLLYEPLDSAYTKAEADARFEPLDTDTGWVNLTYSSPWTGSVQFRRIDNHVYLRGSAARPSGSNATMGTLTTGNRPPSTHNALVREGTTSVAYAIGTDGVITIGAGYTNTNSVSFDGLSFLVD